MRRRDVLRAVLAPLGVALMTGGCGYSLRTSLPPGIKSVHVPVLENKTSEPGIEDFITQALTQAVVQSARVRIARNAQEADATLSGSIVEYRLAALSFDRSANVTSYRLVIGLALTLKEAAENLFRMRIQAQTERLSAPSELRKQRRLIARVKTIQSQRAAAAAKAK